MNKHTYKFLLYEKEILKFISKKTFIRSEYANSEGIKIAEKLNNIIPRNPLFEVRIFPISKPKLRLTHEEEMKAVKLKAMKPLDFETSQHITDRDAVQILGR